MAAISGLLTVMLFVGYFLPTFVAAMRGHRLTKSIMVLNLFLGWTLIGWVVALSMAVGPTGAQRYEPPRPHFDSMTGRRLD